MNPSIVIVRRYQDGCRAFETRMPANSACSCRLAVGTDVPSTVPSLAYVIVNCMGTVERNPEDAFGLLSLGSAKRTL